MSLRRVRIRSRDRRPPGDEKIVRDGLMVCRGGERQSVGKARRAGARKRFREKPDGAKRSLKVRGVFAGNGKDDEGRKGSAAEGDAPRRGRTGGEPERSERPREQ